MAVSCMILGVSGTGKSASMRNCKRDKFALVNVAKKPLPFKGNFAERYDGDNYQDAVNFMKKCKAKSIVIDDAQYLMGNEFMRRVTERGFDKFSEMAQNMWKLLNFINQDLPADKIVYLLGHIERDQDGNEKFKTMGKLIDQCINVEGTCTIVLKTHVADGQYSFLTQNSGHDTVKSPIGMFPSYAIDNDLNYVDEKIRNYYELGDFLSDEDIKEIDEAAKKDDIPITDGKKKSRRTRKENDEKEEKPAEAPVEEKKEEVEEPDGSADNGSSENAGGETTKKRRRTREEVSASNNEKMGQYMNACDEAVAAVAGGREEVPFDEAMDAIDKVPKPEIEKLPRKTRKDRSKPAGEAEEVAKEVAKVSDAIESAEAVETTRTRRRRR